MGTYKGLRIAKAATNLVPKSFKSVTKTITVVSGTVYTASVRGKQGSIVLSGAGTGTVVDGTPVTFTASSTSLTLTATGYLKNIQVEAGAIATPIIWNGETLVTRAADAPADVTGLQAGTKLGTNQGAVVIDLSQCLSAVSGEKYLSIVKDTNNQISLAHHTAGSGILKVQALVASTLTERILTGVNVKDGGKVGLSWSATELKTFHNGVLVDTLAISVPTLYDSLKFTASGVVVYKGIYLFSIRPSDANMILSTT